MSDFDADSYIKDNTNGGFDVDGYIADHSQQDSSATSSAAAKLGPPGLSGVMDGYQKGGISGAWDAMKANKADYDQRMAVNPPVAGTPPMALPAGALGSLGKAAVGLANGEGLGYAAGRTALSAAQGAGMSAMDGKDGESWQDKLDRAESGGKLSGGIQLAAESVPVIGGALGWGASRIGSAISGVDDKLIENYAKRTDQVNDIIKQSGGDVTVAADNIRTDLSNGIQKAKSALNGKISSALENASPDANIPAQSIIDKLEAAKAKLNPNYKASAISDIDEMIGNIKSQAGDDGMLDPKGLYETKQYLNQNSSGAYNKGGQIFTRASEAARAARDAAGEARDAVKQYIPEIAEADGQLSKMHAIESRLNKNLLAPGTPDGALLAAGSGANPRNAATLRKLEDISGVNVAQGAQDLATAKAFAKPDMFSKHVTGRFLTGAVLGGAIGSQTSEGAGAGALAGAAIASPMTLKGVLNAANMAGKMGSAIGIPQVAQAIRQNPFMAQTVAQLGAGQIRRANTDNPMLGTPPSQNNQAPPALMQNGSNGNRAPAKGEDAWAQSGLQKLGIQDQGLTARLLQDPKARQLLIQASDLAPNSKAMKKIMDQINTGWGNSQ